MRIDPDTCDDPVLLAAEVRRLQAVIDSGQCPHVTGTVTQYCTLTPFTLADAEREAVETAFDAMQYASDELGLSQADCDRLVATLRGLLERTWRVRRDIPKWV